MSKTCLTTFVFGEKYQEYIPFLVYSCHSSYPEYGIVIFVYGRLRESVAKQISNLDTSNLKIIENAFSDCEKMNPLKAKSLRWVMFDQCFLNYDYLYVIDIDMLYLPEPIPLHEQHIIHMKRTGLPYDNLLRHLVRHPFRPLDFAYRLKNAGVIALIQYLFNSRNDYRVTGLHFVAVKDYFSIINKEVRNKYKKLIYNNQFLRFTLSSNNETFLYEMLNREGLQPDLLPVQTNAYKMLDFSNPSQEEFRPHHGIHLGIFRDDLQYQRGQNTILDSPVYLYYLKVFKEKYLKDPLFILILKGASNSIQRQFDNLFRYYHISENYA